jgi:hypothetical protein
MGIGSRASFEWGWVMGGGCLPFWLSGVVRREERGRGEEEGVWVGEGGWGRGGLFELEREEGGSKWWVVGGGSGWWWVGKVSRNGEGE